MSKRAFLDQTGDTLVEVMVAAAVLSLVLAGSFTISNKATRVNQTANERTTVSNLMQREIEYIQASHARNPSVFWKDLTEFEDRENTNFCKDDSGSNDGMSAFYTDATFTKIKITRDAANKIQDGDPDDFFDVWVEAVDGISYVDFFVYSCWEGIGSEGFQSSGLVLRLSK